MSAREPIKTSSKFQHKIKIFLSISAHSDALNKQEQHKCGQPFIISAKTLVWNESVQT